MSEESTPYRTKKEQQAFERLINDTADEVMMEAYKAMLNVSTELYRCVLDALRQRIDTWMEEHQEGQ